MVEMFWTAFLTVFSVGAVLSAIAMMCDQDDTEKYFIIGCILCVLMGAAKLMLTEI